MIDTDKYEGHKGPWKPHIIQPLYGNMVLFGFNEQDALLASDSPLLLEEVKRSQLKEYAIVQAEHMKAQVGDNTWHYAMEVWLYPETHYWEVEDEVVLIERYISTNRDAWVKHWGEPSDVVQRRKGK